MKVATRLFCHFSRKNNTQKISYEETAKGKWDNLTHYSKRYPSPNKFQHQDKFFQEFVYGHSVHILGCTPYNSESLRLTSSAMKYVKPKLLILGGICDNYLRLHQKMLKINKHHDHPVWKPQKMQCKERISRYIQTRLEEESQLVWDQNKKEMIWIDHVDKRIVPEQYLTAAHLTSMEDDARIVFGKPSDTLVFEDLIMRYSVGQLQEIADRALVKAKQRQSEETSWQISYTREAVQTYIMSEEPQIHSKQITYQTALLKRYAKIYDKMLMMVPGYFAERMATQVHHIDVKPETIYRDGLKDTNSEVYSLRERILKEDPQVILEKFCLLTLIRDSPIEQQFASGTNVFEKMVFGQLFKNMPIQELFQRYEKAKQATEGKWYELMHQRINNIHVLPGPHIKLTLGEQFNLVTQRATKDFPYTYEQKNHLSVYEDKVKMSKIIDKIRHYLNQEGDKNQIELFDHFLKGHTSKEGIILFSKLLGKMNIELEERLKLPVFHYGAFRGIYKEYLRDFLLRGQENSKMEKTIEKRKTKIQKLMDQHMKKLDDPEELSKYVNGKVGKKSVHVSFDPQQGPIFDPEQIEKLQSMYGQMTPQDEAQMVAQYGQDWYKVEENEQQ